MGDYKLINLINAEFTDLSEDELEKLRFNFFPSTKWPISKYDVVIDSIMENMPMREDTPRIPYVFRVYKYSECSDNIAFGYSYYGGNSRRRDTLEKIEEEMINEIIPIYLYSIGGIEWEPVK